MNRYGLLAQRHWRNRAPARYEALEDPAAHFEALGETIAAQVVQISDELERGLPTDLPYLERVAQLRAIQKQAEEIVLTELVYAVAPEALSLSEEMEQLLAELPGPQMIEDSLARLEDEAAGESQTDPVFTEEQRAKHDQLTALLPLVRLDREPEQMSEAELSERVLALRPFWNPATHSLNAPE